MFENKMNPYQISKVVVLLYAYENAHPRLLLES